MNTKTILILSAFALVAITAYFMVEILFDYIADPNSQIDIGREMGIIRDSEKPNEPSH